MYRRLRLSTAEMRRSQSRKEEQISQNSTLHDSGPPVRQCTSFALKRGIGGMIMVFILLDVSFGPSPFVSVVTKCCSLRECYKSALAPGRRGLRELRQRR